MENDIKAKSWVFCGRLARKIENIDQAVLINSLKAFFYKKPESNVKLSLFS